MSTYKVSFLEVLPDGRKWVYQGKNWKEMDWEDFYARTIAHKNPLQIVVGVRVVDQFTGVKVFEKEEK